MSPLALLQKMIEVRQRMLDRKMELLSAGAGSPDEVDSAEMDLLEAELQLAREKEKIG